MFGFMEYNGIELSKIEWGGMKWNGIDRNEINLPSLTSEIGGKQI
jgi:hypothetical protein